jgi:general secretion pathway protein F
VSLLVVLFLLGYVVPRFADVYAEMGDRLPFASRVLLGVGQAIGAHAWSALAALVLLVVAVIWGAGRPAVRAGFGRLLYRVPQLRSVLSATDLARLYRTLALLLHGGVPLVRSLEIVRGLLPPGLAARLDQCRQSISEGAGFAASMERHGLSTVVADRFFRVGERGGELARAIDRAAQFHEEEVARGAEWLGRLIGPVLMLAMGLLIGVVVILMYLPIFQLAEAVQ